ncbi:P-loop containing nucleoside triphosphate hydrolase protein [Gymnopus androsaceus JB14]|uniref:P-loop containing nucleoside triphosphate hydrolase protein n=1 Tax=Gymnopus androsaceus JB14 TaxID=1447944 RepID=A0A6A4HSL7_9AGAR|nr:P-loop containing nucleoside triphosphate hydrolase protein [Gymnopus androsaceus JB14]
MSISRAHTFPDELFSSSRLISLAAVEEALAQFEVAVQINFQRPGFLIEDLLQHQQQHALPLVLACINDDTFDPLRTYLHSLFQAEYKVLAGSVLLPVLTKLSQFLIFNELPSSLLLRHIIRTNFRTVEAAIAVLKTLSAMTFVEERAISEDKGKDITFQVRKKGKKHVRAKTKAIDCKPFETIGSEIPSTRIEAERLTVDILKTLEGILDFYFDNLRRTDVGLQIKQSLISSVCEPIASGNLVSKPLQDQSAPAEDVPAAFPKVQPMKAALHFDSVEGFGEWTIFISQNADTELRTRHRRDKTSFDIIVKKIRELSNGHFSADNQKRLSGPSSEVPVFEAKMTGDLRLIYQVDIVANDEEKDKRSRSLESTRIAQMDNRMWRSISRQLDRKGKEYRNRCAVRIRAENADEKTFVPALFPPLPEIPEDEPSNWLAEDDPVHSRFLMDKYVVFSQPLLNTMLADLDATFPHLVSMKEKQIIEYPYSCYVIGRSGTGKTTTLLFKMLLVERTHQMMSSDAPKPRQIFVTQSRILAKKVEQYYGTLGRSLTASSQSLAQLCEHRASQGVSVLDEEGDMIDVDDLVDWSGDLPSKFSDLRDEHFPLFTTYNGLCSMLEADIADAQCSVTIPVNSVMGGRGVLSVTYEVFMRDYWPHFAQSLTTKLDPSLVFSELIGWQIFIISFINQLTTGGQGVIKGCEETLDGPKHFLEPVAYRNLSKRSQSTFADNREELYELFTSYLGKKKRYGDIDGADRAHKILDFFKSQGIPGQKIDRLYVDEVQDNLLIDTLILRMLCHDENGLFWAGDTAQTISVGSSFRFNGLKAFQWRLEEKRRSTLIGTQLAVQPETFQLSVNYRSHSGIVDCAHSIIELITRFWKDSIDRLAPEKGVVAGLKPLFFVGWDESDAGSLDQFVFGDSGNRIEFGAQQCILVRNEAARDRLKAKLGEQGLEFNDVLLYDFFGDSPAKLSQWRIILAALNDRATFSVPDFERNRQRYASICTELKFLYVAITRARENVWIIDSSENGEPMRMYWTERDLVRNIKPGTNAPRLATSSSTEEWAVQGRHLFDRKKWAEAKHCFERALQPDKVAIAEAYLLREKAERSSLDTKPNIKLRNQRFCEAAEAFLKCNCYEKAGEFVLAARSYHTARRFDDSVRCYRKADHYDEAVSIVQTEKDVEPSLAADTIRVAKIFYFNQVQSLPSCPDRDKKLRQAGTLFESLDDQLEYLEDRDMDIARAALLVAHGRPREAAELHLSEGRTLEAIYFFIQDTENADSARRAIECILDGLWRKLNFSVPSEHLAEDAGLYKLFELVKKVNQSLLIQNYRNEIKMFQAILSKARPVLCELGQTFFNANNLPAALLCLDHYYTSPLPFNNLTVYPNGRGAGHLPLVSTAFIARTFARKAGRRG